MTKLQQS